MGVGPENDHSAGPDYDEHIGGLVYRFTIGRKSQAMHEPSPSVNRAAWSAIITAGEAGAVTLANHLASNHADLSTWWQARSDTERGLLRVALIAGRGL